MARMRRLLLTMTCAVTLVAGCGTATDPARISVPNGSSGPPAQPLNTAPADPSGFTLVARGDVLIHPPITDQATADGNGKRDYRQVMAGVKATISAADLAICHLETP